MLLPWNIHYFTFTEIAVTWGIVKIHLWILDSSQLRRFCLALQFHCKISWRFSLIMQFHCKASYFIVLGFNLNLADVQQIQKKQISNVGMYQMFHWSICVTCILNYKKPGTNYSSHDSLIQVYQLKGTPNEVQVLCWII